MYHCCHSNHVWYVKSCFQNRVWKRIIQFIFRTYYSGHVVERKLFAVLNLKFNCVVINKITRTSNKIGKLGSEFSASLPSENHCQHFYSVRNCFLSRKTFAETNIYFVIVDSKQRPGRSSIKRLGQDEWQCQKAKGGRRCDIPWKGSVQTRLWRQQVRVLKFFPGSMEAATAPFSSFWQK